MFYSVHTVQSGHSELGVQQCICVQSVHVTIVLRASDSWDLQGFTRITRIYPSMTEDTGAVN